VRRAKKADVEGMGKNMGKGGKEIKGKRKGRKR
jgi:hypothetical protein